MPSEMPLSESKRESPRLSTDRNTPQSSLDTCLIKASRDRILSRREIEGLIAEGCLLLILDGHVLNLDGWIEDHPGGRLPLLHMVGCDASSEIAAYHSGPTMRRMIAYRIGRVEDGWRNMKPPIRGGIFEALGPPKPEVGCVAGQVDCPVDICDSPAEESAGYIGAGKETCSAQRRQRVGYCRLVEKDSIEVDPAAASRDSQIYGAMRAEVEQCLTIYPSPDTDTQRAITARYSALHRRIKAEGFYTCNYYEYLAELCRYVVLFAISMTLLNAKWFISSAVFLGFFWHQIMFTAHDAGHRAITHLFVPDTLIGIFIADFCCGLSLGWWKSSHNVHHLVPNAPEHDPDIQNTPLFATCPSQLNKTRSTYYEFDFAWDTACEILLPYQKYTYYPIMAVARFNLYALSWCHLLSPRARQLGAAAWTRPVEMAAMCCYWYLFGYTLVFKTLPDWPTRVAFVLVSHMSSMILHVQITLSHWGMPTCDLGTEECFAQKQLRTTMDVMCPHWLDWFHGGLQFQAVHHLFPRVQRHNLRRLQPLARQFCADTGIPYSIHGFVDSNSRVLGRLSDISNQLMMLGRCQDHMATTGDSALH